MRITRIRQAGACWHRRQRLPGGPLLDATYRAIQQNTKTFQDLDARCGRETEFIQVRRCIEAGIAQSGPPIQPGDLFAPGQLQVENVRGLRIELHGRGLAVE